MKKYILIPVVAFIALTAAVTADIFSSLDISREQAKQRLLESMGEGYIVSGEHDLVSKAKSLPVEMRVAGIRQLIKLAKEYTSGDEFAADYKKWRNGKLNPGQKSRLGVPKLRRMLDNAVDRALDSRENEDRYPADPNKLIKKRLEEFLEVSGSVDFDAKLSGSMFVNPEYEQKDDKWKMCYRVGKETIAAAREEAQVWLKEIN
ncbi:MAG: hypothetical protein JNK79_11840 [Chitinophagaceae bacterium]|nr:hypothetical protein [Chitinophagaceae bacterium]